jgi:hypothetical protein
MVSWGLESAPAEENPAARGGNRRINGIKHVRDMDTGILLASNDTRIKSAGLRAHAAFTAPLFF